MNVNVDLNLNLKVANQAEARPPTWAQEMEVLKARLSSVEEERDAAVPATECKRQATMRSTLSTDILLMPVHVPKDLDDWMHGWNIDLQEALSAGSGPRVSVLIAKLSEGAHMLTLTGSRAGAMQLTKSWSPPQGRFRCSRCFGASFWTTLPGMWLHASVCHRSACHVVRCGCS